MKRHDLLIGIVVFLAVFPACQRAPNAPERPPESEVIISTGTVGVGGSLSDVLHRSGVEDSAIAAIQASLKGMLNLRRIKANDRYEVYRSTSGTLVKLTYWPNSFEHITVLPTPNGSYQSRLERLPTQSSLVGVSGKIQVSLWEATTAQGIAPEMIYRFADIFGWRIDFLTEPRAGDTYKLVWKRTKTESAIRDDEIVCALYQGKETGVVYAFELAGEYFDEKGDSLRGEFLRAPLAFRRISSRYTNARYHPILRYWRPHHGIDYSAARGTPVVSLGDGTVIAKGYKGGLGNEIRIRHAGSYVSIYGHLMGYARGLRLGMSVKQGQVVGYVGSTGLSTGPHLHFGMERNGQLINFLAMKSALKRRSVPAGERDRFRNLKKEAFGRFTKLDQVSTAIQDIP